MVEHETVVSAAMLGHKRSLSFCTALILLASALLPACDDDDKELGAAGESCAARADCEEGLSCIAQVCIDVKGDSDGGMPGRLPGGACASRRDCAEGLVCLQNRCATAAMGMSVDGQRYSGHGESCAAQNDCEPDLRCLSGTCRKQMLDLEATGKACVRVECESRDDCCGSFKPNDNCDDYKKNCETDPIFCNTYRSLCLCSLDCVDEQCMAGADGCSENAECTSTQTPFCVSGKCSQCEADENCPGAGSQCVSGVCMSPCRVDENCPSLHACEDGECVETGCQSDRECVFLENSERAVCSERECLVPCQVDSDCTGEAAAAGQGTFQICQEGRCQFVGCETDAECRAYLGLSEQRSEARALCR